MRALREAGLTESESKVYLALLRKGTLTKSPLVRAAAIAPSKLYEVTDGLIRKGLVSAVTKDGVKQFAAASPLKLKELVALRREALLTADAHIDALLPSLLAGRQGDGPDISLFSGWEGMATVYQQTLQEHKRTTAYVIGASAGDERMVRFFTKYGAIAHAAKVHIKAIFNTTARKYVAEIERNRGVRYEKRFLFSKTPTELTVIGETTLIIFMREEPTVIRIVNKETAETFKQYFSELWQNAKR